MVKVDRLGWASSDAALAATASQAFGTSASGDRIARTGAVSHEAVEVKVAAGAAANVDV